MELGLNITNKSNGAQYLWILGKTFHFILLSCGNLKQSIRTLKSSKRKGKVIACLDKKRRNTFDGKEKSLSASFAILYDFVDGYLISSYEDLNEDIDPLLNYRLCNEAFKPIYLQIPDDMLYEELDEVISYSKLSDIEGLYIHNRRLLEYAVKKCNGLIDVVADGIKSPDDINELRETGVNAVSLRSCKMPLFSLLYALFGLRVF